MTATERSPRVPQVLLIAAGLVVVIAGMRAASALLQPFLVAAFLSLVGAPPVLWLRRKGLPSVLAVLLVVLAMVGVGIVLGVLLGTSLNDFTRALPTYQERLQQEISGLLTWLRGHGVDVPENILTSFLDVGAVMRLTANVFRSLSGMLANAFLIVITVIFILLEVSSFTNKMRLALHDPEATFERVNTVAENVNRYLAIKTAVSLVTGIVIAVWVSLLGVGHPFLWGLLAFLLNYVPNIGSILAAVPAVLLGLVQHGPGTSLLVALGYLVVNVLMGNAVEPRFMGKGLGLSTLVVFLSLVFWGWVFGPIGMLFSVPLTMTMKIALESRQETHWVAIMLGAGGAAAKAAATGPEKQEDQSDTSVSQG
jgi:predicted PurR-regulated permease PerM